MKIITPGTVESPTIRMTCPKCRCVFEGIKGFEIKLHDGQREDMYWSCKCPEPGCDQTVTKQA